MVIRQLALLTVLTGTPQQALLGTHEHDTSLHIVGDALAGLTDARGQEDVIELALELAVELVKRDEFSLDIDRLAAFVGGPLFEAAALRLGVPQALELMERLAPVIATGDPNESVAAAQPPLRLHARRATTPIRYVLLVATPAFALLFIEAGRIVELWLGPGHDASAVAIRILAAGYLLNVVSGAFTTVTQGIGCIAGPQGLREQVDQHLACCCTADPSQTPDTRLDHEPLIAIVRAGLAVGCNNLDQGCAGPISL